MTGPRGGAGTGGQWCEARTGANQVANLFHRSVIFPAGCLDHGSTRGGAAEGEVVDDSGATLGYEAAAAVLP